MSAASNTASVPQPQAALPPSSSRPSGQSAAGFGTNSGKTDQSGPKLPPVNETKATAALADKLPQRPAASSVVSGGTPAAVETAPLKPTEVLIQPDTCGAEPSEERALIAEGFALLVSQVRRSSRGGRPTVIDEPMKARIATLMGAGLSLRQAAACLGIGHQTISRAVAADKQLKHDIEVARTRATLHPLACVLREAGRNWKAAVWLLDHLQKVAYHEKTPLERAEDTAVRRTEDSLARQLTPRMLAQAEAELAAQSGATPSAAPPRRSPRS
ncbi:MAG TPA: hypothetical protein VMP01_27305 [Pirellulaceae bacterium]|nr:hypothetical protein [Pirellulaceae bacterium]